MAKSCGCQSDCGCQCGYLPYTMTVNFSGLTDKTHASGCPLEFHSVIGSGAAGLLTGPGGCDGNEDPRCLRAEGSDSPTEVTIQCESTTSFYPSDRGGIASVELTAKGSCYAMLGREAPTISVSGRGSGATFTVTLDQAVQNGCPGDKYWQVSGVKVSGGTGYGTQLGAPTTPYFDSYGGRWVLAIDRAAGDQKIEDATAVIITEPPEEPTLELHAACGSGAVIVPVMGATGWGAGDIQVTGYAPASLSDFVSVKAANGASVLPAIGVVTRKVEDPSADLHFPDGFVPTLAESAYADGVPYWTVTDLSIPGGASTSADWYVGKIFTGGDAIGRCTQIDSTGHATGIEVIHGGRLGKTASPFNSVGIASVQVVTPGVYRVVEADGSHSQPTLSVNAVGSSAYSVTTIPTRWGVLSCTVQNGGRGYCVGSKVTAKVVASNHEILNDSEFVGVVDAVDEDGAITSVSVTHPGMYAYYAGTPTAVHVRNRGKYYREDKDLPPYVAVVHASPACGGGTGGHVYGVVNDSTISDDFGCVTDLQIAENGNNYLAWTWSQIKSSAFNGRSFVLQAAEAIPLVSACVTSCFGSGATVGITTKYVPWDGSPSSIHGITLDSKGNGYAVYGRDEPAIAITAGGWFPNIGYLTSGSGATFTPTLSKATDACGLPCWQIESVAVEGGSCFNANFRTKPTLSANTTRGSGASFDIVLVEAEHCGKTKWIVDSISAFCGRGYVDGDPVIISAPGGVSVLDEATAVLSTTPAGGVASVTITNPGGYFIPGPDEYLRVNVDGVEAKPAVLKIHADKHGVPTGVTVVSKGEYYHEDPSLPPHVADVAVEILQASGSNGSGAQIDVTVDSNTSSEGFGSIAVATLTKNGDNYSFFGAPARCTYVGGCSNRNGTDGCLEPGVEVTLRFHETGNAIDVTSDLGQSYHAFQDAQDCQSLGSIQISGATIVSGGTLPHGSNYCCAETPIFAFDFCSLNDIAITGPNGSADEWNVLNLLGQGWVDPVKGNRTLAATVGVGMYFNSPVAGECYKPVLIVNVETGVGEIDANGRIFNLLNGPFPTATFVGEVGQNSVSINIPQCLLISAGGDLIPEDFELPQSATLQVSADVLCASIPCANNPFL